MSDGLAAAFDSLVDEMCRCTDVGSASEVGAKITALFENAEEPSEADQQRIMESMRRMEAWLMKLGKEAGAGS